MRLVTTLFFADSHHSFGKSDLLDEVFFEALLLLEELVVGLICQDDDHVDLIHFYSQDRERIGFELVVELTVKLAVDGGQRSELCGLLEGVLVGGIAGESDFCLRLVIMLQI